MPIDMEIMKENLQNSNGTHQTIIVQQAVNKSNGIGTAGFVLSLLGFVFCWVPVLDWILWLLGLIFSFCGMFKQPRGLAIAGFVISCISLIVLLTVIGAILALFA